MIFDFEAITSELARLQAEKKDFMVRLSQWTQSKNKEIAGLRQQLEKAQRDNEALKRVLAIMSQP